MRTRRFESRAHRVRMAAVTSGPKQLPALRRRDDPGRPRRADCSEDVFGDVEKSEPVASRKSGNSRREGAVRSGANRVRRPCRRADFGEGRLGRGAIVRLWRLSSLRRARDFDGGYGLANNGRWNTTGRRVTDCSTVPSLTALEKRVHVTDTSLLPLEHPICTDSGITRPLRATISWSP
jgi:hypothetical protein